MKRTALIILSLLTVLSLTACTYDRSDNNNIKTDSGMAELQELQEEQNNKDSEIQKEKVLRTLAVTGNGKTINLPCKVSDLKTLGLTFKQPGNDDTNEDGTYISHDMTGFGRGDCWTQAEANENNKVGIDAWNYSGKNSPFENLTVNRIYSYSQDISILGITPGKTTKKEVVSTFGETQRKEIEREGYYTANCDFSNRCMLGENVWIKYYYLTAYYDDNDMVSEITLKYLP